MLYSCVVYQTDVTATAHVFTSLITKTKYSQSPSRRSCNLNVIKKKGEMKTKGTPDLHPTKNQNVK